MGILTANSKNVATYAKRFPLGCWSYLGPGCEKKWFAESGHPVFWATSPLRRRIEKERWWKENHSH